MVKQKIKGLKKSLKKRFSRKQQAKSYKHQFAKQTQYKPINEAQLLQKYPKLSKTFEFKRFFYSNATCLTQPKNQQIYSVRGKKVIDKKIEVRCVTQFDQNGQRLTKQEIRINRMKEMSVKSQTKSCQLSDKFEEQQMSSDQQQSQQQQSQSSNFQQSKNQNQKQINQNLQEEANQQDPEQTPQKQQKINSLQAQILNQDIIEISQAYPTNLMDLQIQKSFDQKQNDSSIIKAIEVIEIEDQSMLVQEVIQIEDQQSVNQEKLEVPKLRSRQRIIDQHRKNINQLDLTYQKRNKKIKQVLNNPSLLQAQIQKNKKSDVLSVQVQQSSSKRIVDESSSCEEVYKQKQTNSKQQNQIVQIKQQSCKNLNKKSVIFKDKQNLLFQNKKETNSQKTSSHKEEEKFQLLIESLQPSKQICQQPILLNIPKTQLKPFCIQAINLDKDHNSLLIQNSFSISISPNDKIQQSNIKKNQLRQTSIQDKNIKNQPISKTKKQKQKQKQKVFIAKRTQKNKVNYSTAQILQTFQTTSKQDEDQSSYMNMEIPKLKKPVQEMCDEGQFTCMYDKNGRIIKQNSVKGQNQKIQVQNKQKIKQSVFTFKESFQVTPLFKIVNSDELQKINNSQKLPKETCFGQKTPTTLQQMLAPVEDLRKQITQNNLQQLKNDKSAIIAQQTQREMIEQHIEIKQPTLQIIKHPQSHPQPQKLRKDEITQKIRQTIRKTYLDAIKKQKQKQKQKQRQIKMNMNMNKSIQNQVPHLNPVNHQIEVSSLIQKVSQKQKLSKQSFVNDFRQKISQFLQRKKSKATQQQSTLNLRQFEQINLKQKQIEHYQNVQISIKEQHYQLFNQLNQNNISMENRNQNSLSLQFQIKKQPTIIKNNLNSMGWMNKKIISQSSQMEEEVGQIQYLKYQDIKRENAIADVHDNEEEDNPQPQLNIKFQSIESMEIQQSTQKSAEIQFCNLRPNFQTPYKHSKKLNQLKKYKVQNQNGSIDLQKQVNFSPYKPQNFHSNMEIDMSNNVQNQQSQNQLQVKQQSKNNKPIDQEGNTDKDQSEQIQNRNVEQEVNDDDMNIVNDELNIIKKQSEMQQKQQQYDSRLQSEDDVQNSNKKQDSWQVQKKPKTEQKIQNQHQYQDQELPLSQSQQKKISKRRGRPKKQKKIKKHLKYNGTSKDKSKKSSNNQNQQQQQSQLFMTQHKKKKHKMLMRNRKKKQKKHKKEKQIKQQEKEQQRVSYKQSSEQPQPSQIKKGRKMTIPQQIQPPKSAPQAKKKKINGQLEQNANHQQNSVSIQIRRPRGRPKRAVVSQKRIDYNQQSSEDEPMQKKSSIFSNKLSDLKNADQSDFSQKRSSRFNLDSNNSKFQKQKRFVTNHKCHNQKCPHLFDCSCGGQFQKWIQVTKHFRKVHNSTIQKGDIVEVKGNKKQFKDIKQFLSQKLVVNPIRQKRTLEHGKMYLQTSIGNFFKKKGQKQVKDQQ